MESISKSEENKEEFYNDGNNRIHEICQEI